MTSILVLGGGGHAKVVLDAVQEMGHPVVGFLDKDPLLDPFENAKRLGDADPTRFSTFTPAEVFLANGFGYIGKGSLRADNFILWRKCGFNFLTVQHPTAIIAQDVRLNEGAQVLAGAVIQTGVCVGENAIINTRATVDHDCNIGKHVHIAPGAVLSGEVRVGEGTHIGTGAIIIQGINIGCNSVVGAGSVVVKDVPANTQVMGVPAHSNSKSIA